MLPRCVLSLSLLAGLLCASDTTILELTSPLGTKFYSKPDHKGVVAAAQHASAADPKNVKLLLKLSQAQNSVQQIQEAVETCTRALIIEPKNADILLERGHRELPLRRFERARDDLKRATELDPKLSEAYYHLGLAYFFLGDFGPSADAFCKGVTTVKDQDALVNYTNWCYAASRRAGRAEKATEALAKIGPDMKSNPGHTVHYFNLVRFFQGRATESAITPPAPKPGDDESELLFDTVSFGIGNWRLANGEKDKAAEYFRRIAKGHVWYTWGFVGSETELARMGKK